MTPLFSITNTITRDEYQTFNMAVLKKEFHFVRSLIIINVCALFIMMSIMGETLITDFKHFWWGIIFIVVMLCCTNLFYLTRPKKKANKAFDENKLMQNQEYTVSFYEDHSEHISSFGNSSIAYDKLTKIIETPSHFYLMHSKGQGTIIPKGKAGEGFVDFIHKIKEKYNI